MMTIKDYEARDKLIEASPAAVLAPVQPQYLAVNRYSVSELVHMAQLISKSVTLPKALQDHPDDILAVMLAGRELGIGPMQSARQIDIIQGQTAIRTELKLALAKRAGHDIRPMERSARMVRVGCLTHASHVVEWALTREDAISPEAVIVSEVPDLREKRGTWQSYWGAMLWARAVGQLCREHCPEAVGGFYSVEELGGDGD